MIAINVERCTGCAACVEVCPTGALYLVAGKATVDQAFCRACEACLAACPAEAITFSEQEEPAKEVIRLPALRQEAIQVRVPAAPVSWRSRVLPLIGSVLVWTEREIVPWLADLMDRQEHRTGRLPAGGARRREIRASGAKGGGRQRRHRRRGRSD